jgi:hypothetical protein
LAINALNELIGINMENNKFKFRAWVPEQNYMAYQGTPDLETLSSFMHHFGENELMISLNQNDKNGKEIYEGDVIVWSGKDLKLDLEFKHYCIVVFDRSDWNGWSLKPLQYNGYGTIPIGPHGALLSDIEILGNLEENPELLFIE